MKKILSNVPCTYNQIHMWSSSFKSALCGIQCVMSMQGMRSLLEYSFFMEMFPCQAVMWMSQFSTWFYVFFSLYFVKHALLHLNTRLLSGHEHFPDQLLFCWLWRASTCLLKVYFSVPCILCITGIISRFSF